MEMAPKGQRETTVQDGDTIEFIKKFINKKKRNAWEIHLFNFWN